MTPSRGQEDLYARMMKMKKKDFTCFGQSTGIGIDIGVEEG